MDIKGLQAIGKQMQEALTCQDCDGILFIAGNSPQELEPIDPYKHCTCPGGPLWNVLLASGLGLQLQLEQGQELYPDIAPSVAYFFDEAWLSADPLLWRDIVQYSFTLAALSAKIDPANNPESPIF